MRHILKLHRDLNTEALPQISHNHTIETFNVSIHKQQWLDLNNKIFAHHVDQGNWAMADLENVQGATGLITYKGTNGMPVRQVSLIRVKDGGRELVGQPSPDANLIPAPRMQ